MLTVVTLVATGWVSVRVIRLERQRIDEARRAKVEENVSLALWRIDSLVAPLVAMENARPFQDYGQAQQDPHLPQEEPKLENRYFTVEVFSDEEQLVQQVRPVHGEVPTALNETSEVSRLMAELPKPTIQLSEPPMLQFDAVATKGSQEKPQKNAKPVGTGKVAISKSSTRSGLEYQARQSTLNRAMSNYNQYMAPNSSQQSAQAPLLSRQQAVINTQAPAPSPYSSSSNLPATSPSQQTEAANQPDSANNYPTPGPTISVLPQANSSQVQQSAPESQPDYQPQMPAAIPQMAPMDQQEAFSYDMPEMQQQVQQAADQAWDVPESNDAWAPMRPVCVGDQLLLLRRVRFGGHSFLQGCQLDWPRLSSFLEKEVTDLLPKARLVLDDKQNALGRMLASLPVRLEPGPLPTSDRTQFSATLTPVLISVALAFSCVLLSIGEFAVLLQGMIRLGRRRSEFVTAVTHELRTPLTTFRMYSEMLAEGMVPPESQKTYLQTLESEADRLTHLVENVLSSARLERGRHTGRIETLSFSELISPIASRMTKRCQRVQMQLDVQMDDQVSETTVHTNPSAVEQILWNLVDNACKYASSAEDRTIKILCEAQDGVGVTVTVSDHGPGLAREVRRRLFCGFSKTASEAARSAPGVGLGLALSRRLARDLGGDLEFISTEQGACFRLTLLAK